MLLSQDGEAPNLRTDNLFAVQQHVSPVVMQPSQKPAHNLQMASIVHKQNSEVNNCLALDSQPEIDWCC